MHLILLPRSTLEQAFHTKGDTAPMPSRRMALDLVPDSFRASTLLSTALAVLMIAPSKSHLNAAKPET